MNNLYIIIVIVTCFIIDVQSKDCAAIRERATRKCTSLTDKYQQACIERRMKRSSCYTICETCDCVQCSDDQCDCSSCCSSTQPPCTTRYCCYRRCYKECDSVDCRRDCRSNCTESLAKPTEKAIPANLLAPQNNVTTIINIHTLVNNTKKIEQPVYQNITNTYSVVPQNIIKKVQCCEVVVQKCEPHFDPYFRIHCRYEKEYDCGDICLKETMKADDTIEEARGTFNGTEIETITQVVIEPEFDVITLPTPEVPPLPNITHNDVKTNFPNEIPNVFPYQPPIYQYQPPCIPYWPYLTCNTPVLQNPRPKGNTIQKEQSKPSPCSFQPYWPYTNCNQRESDCSRCHSMPQCPVVCQYSYNPPAMMPFGYPIPPCLNFNGCNPYFGYGYPMPYFGYPQITYGPIWSQVFKKKVPAVKSSPFKRSTNAGLENKV